MKNTLIELLVVFQPCSTKYSKILKTRITITFSFNTIQHIIRHPPRARVYLDRREGNHIILSNTRLKQRHCNLFSSRNYIRRTFFFLLSLPRQQTRVIDIPWHKTVSRQQSQLQNPQLIKFCYHFDNVCVYPFSWCFIHKYT